MPEASRVLDLPVTLALVEHLHLAEDAATAVTWSLLNDLEGKVERRLRCKSTVCVCVEEKHRAPTVMLISGEEDEPSNFPMRSHPWFCVL